MTVHLCDRCGDVTVDTEPCRCATPYNPVEVRRRHRDAVTRAQAIDALVSRARDAQRAA